MASLALQRRPVRAEQTRRESSESEKDAKLAKAGVRKQRGGEGGGKHHHRRSAGPVDSGNASSEHCLPIAAISQYSPRGTQSSSGPERYWPVAVA
jgi:hypothetical protein